MSQFRAELPGSFRPPIAGIRSMAPVDPDEPVAATVVLRRRAEPEASPAAGALTREELAERYGADPADIELATRTMTTFAVAVVASDQASRRLRVVGPASALGSLFGADLQRARSVDAMAGDEVEHRYREGSLSVPAALSGVVVAVLGLDTRPQTRANLRAARTVTTSFTPVQLADIYRMPAADGTGQTLAIIELGGGYRDSDLKHYFAGLGLTAPKVRAVAVDGAKNSPGQDPTGADGEVLLDIEVAGGVAPNADLAVYFAPNTDAGFLDAIADAAHATPTPTAISISWGQSEDLWTPQARSAMDAAFADACLLGVTVTVAAGDNGSSDAAGGSSGGQPHVDFPASSPHVLACGGTSLRADPASGAVSSETVWNDGNSGGATGGGVSDAFSLPTWQRAAGVPRRSAATTSGRGVPDVAGVADPQTGYQVYIDGKDMVYGGTSAVAPLWAGLICRLSQVLGRPIGLLQPSIYPAAGTRATGLRDITSGDNGAYHAAPGWDPCTGLGVPDGTALLDQLRRSTAGS